jgi:predicted transcriptional regulator
MSASDIPDQLVIDRPEQLAALTSPVRVELLETFGLLGPCSVADVAGHMDRAADSLYYHLRKLLAVGLLEHVEDRKQVTRSEAIYRLPAKEIEIARHTKGDARAQTSKAIQTLMRLAGRELDGWMDDESAVDEGPKRRLYGRRMRGRLSWKAVAEINRHLTAIEEVFAHEAQRKNRAAGQAVAFTVVLTPGGE